MKLKYMIPALCICTCTAMPEMLHAQDDSLKKDSTERPFNAMDYVLQKRYIPQGREVNNSQPGKNFSLSVMGGVNKLRGSSSLPAWVNGGIALKLLENILAFRRAEPQLSILLKLVLKRPHVRFVATDRGNKAHGSFGKKTRNFSHCIIHNNPTFQVLFDPFCCKLRKTFSSVFTQAAFSASSTSPHTSRNRSTEIAC